MSRWFRFYDDVINDPKVLSLSDACFRGWVGLLCVASKNGGTLPSTADLAFHLRMKPQRVAALIAELTAAGLIDKTEDGFAPHNWDGRQYKTDNSTERVAKYREKRKANGLPALGDYTKFKPALIQRDGEQCVYCLAAGVLVVDHMEPIALGGTDHLDNLGLACKPCNSGKSGRTPEMARMRIAVTSASGALARYRDTLKSVTVTETPPETEQIQITETEQKKETREVALSVEPSDFDAFWSEWPNKVGKPAAMKAFNAAVKRGAVLWDIQDGLKNYIRDKPPDRPWLNPATFLNQNRWEDQPASIAAVPPVRASTVYQQRQVESREILDEISQSIARRSGAADFIALRNDPGDGRALVRSGPSSDVIDLPAKHHRSGG